MDGSVIRPAEGVEKLKSSLSPFLSLPGHTTRMGNSSYFHSFFFVRIFIPHQIMVRGLYYSCVFVHFVGFFFLDS